MANRTRNVQSSTIQDNGIIMELTMKCFKCGSVNTLNDTIGRNVIKFACKDCKVIILKPTDSELQRLVNMNMDISNTDIADIAKLINEWRNDDDKHISN